VCFFPQGDGDAARRAAADFPYLRKSAGHLLSKHRFVSAPFARTLSDGSWARHAAHANAMGRRLAAGCRALGSELLFPADASAVFVRLSDDAHAGLQAKGHGYYPFGPPAWKCYRLMCAFDTCEEDVKGLLADLESVLCGAARA